MGLELKEMLKRILEIIQRIRTMEITSRTQLAVFAVVLAFGLLNCVLGYRLLRFWVMLSGFAIGAAAGYFAADRLELGRNLYYLMTMIAFGIILAVIAFLIYKAGIFLLGAGFGTVTGIYLLRPTSSAVFFICILIGVAVGMLALRYSKGVLIAVTSMMGGGLAGLSLAKIGRLPELPYGVGMSIGFALLGMLVQYFFNKDEEEDEEEEEEEEPVQAEKKRRNTADSVDFRLPGSYDDTDDPDETDFFNDPE